MYINYKGKNYYWDLDRCRENIFQLLVLLGGIICFVINGIVCSPF